MHHKLSPRRVYAIERDKAIEKNLKSSTKKQQKRWLTINKRGLGAKGKQSFGTGPKDTYPPCMMKLGLITKVAVTPANAPDGKALKHICPKEGMVLGDKGYCSKEASLTMKQNGCVSKAILKNNMRGKDFERDRRYSQSKEYFAKEHFRWQCKRARYIGISQESISGSYAGAHSQFRATDQGTGRHFSNWVKRVPLTLISWKARNQGGNPIRNFGN